LALLLPLAPELLHELLQDLQELGRIILAAALAALAAALRHLLSQLRDWLSMSMGFIVHLLV
jgi:hypothetical protein